MLALSLSDKFCCFGIFVFVFNFFVFVFNRFPFFRFSFHHFFVLVLVFVNEFVFSRFSPFSFSFSLTQITLLISHGLQRHHHHSEFLKWAKYWKIYARTTVTQSQLS